MAQMCSAVSGEVLAVLSSGALRAMFEIVEPFFDRNLASCKDPTMIPISSCSLVHHGRSRENDGTWGCAGELLGATKPGLNFSAEAEVLHVSSYCSSICGRWL